jgi:hypothetical protein
MVAAEGRDFDNFRPEHVRQAETAANQTAVAEQLTHLLRRGVGGDVKIFGFLPSSRSRTPPPTSQDS